MGRFGPESFRPNFNMVGYIGMGNIFEGFKVNVEMDRKIDRWIDRLTQHDR